MGQQELSLLVEELKAEVTKSPRLNRRSVVDRAIGTNIAALDLILDKGDAARASVTPGEGARVLKALADEFADVSRTLRGLALR